MYGGRGGGEVARCMGVTKRRRESSNMYGGSGGGEVASMYGDRG